MRYPWANVLLLVLVACAGVTGYFALTTGASKGAYATGLHAAGGLAAVALFWWKGANMRRGLRPVAWRRSAGRNPASIALSGALLTVLALGVAWSHTGPFGFLGFSGLTWHIYVSGLVFALALWHAARHRYSLRMRYWAERRAFLQAGGIFLGGLALWRLGEGLSAVLDLPGQDRRFTGSYETGSFQANAFPSVRWINDDPDRIDASAWRLRVGGAVARPLDLTYEALGKRLASKTATLDCTGGWYMTQVAVAPPVANIG